MAATLALVLAEGKVWHYWIGVAIALGSILTVIALVIGYLVKVQAPQYPPSRRK